MRFRTADSFVVAMAAIAAALPAVAQISSPGPAQSNVEQAAITRGPGVTRQSVRFDRRPLRVGTAGEARAILKLAEEPSFDDRPEEIRTACYHALAETGGDSVVAALEAQVTQGNWFARASWRRSAAAYALARINTEAARAALDRGLKHSSETVRASCRDALERRAA